MIYTMSDIHGEFDKFIEMLELINFSKDDTLYVLGDIFDRGLKPLEILEYIRKPENNNIKLLLGNHELLFKTAYEDNQYLHAWLVNGGITTHNALQSKGEEYIKDVFEYISNLPLIEIVDKFILVHAGLFIPNESGNLKIDDLLKMQSLDDLLWSRQFVNSDKHFQDYTVICGHTPTINYMPENKKAKILYSTGKIMIDCGAVFSNSNGRLGCLRLDDLEEFYV